MSNGSDIASEIASALAEVGTDAGAGALVATINRKPVDAPTNPWETPSEVSPTEYSVNVIRDSWRRDELNNSLVLATDLKLLAQAGVVVPATDDTVTVQGEEYEIISVLPEAVGGVDLYYIIQARK